MGYGERSALSDKDAGCRHSRSYVKDEDAGSGVEIRQNTPSNCATYHSFSSRFCFGVTFPHYALDFDAKTGWVFSGVRWLVAFR